MSRQAKKFYRVLAWFFSVVIAAGTFVGCRDLRDKIGPPATKYGPPQAKYGPPAVTSMYDNNKKGNVTENE